MDNSQENRDAAYDRDFDLDQILKRIWSGRWIIVVGAALMSALALIAAFLQPNVYRADALLAPTQDVGSGSLTSLASQFGGIASLAGLDIGGDTGNKTTLGIEVLQSRKFIFDFIDRHDILAQLMAANGWDDDSNQLKFDDSNYDSRKGQWISWGWFGDKEQPSRLEAYEEFSDILNVRKFAETGYVTISIDHYSPAVAKQWVDWLVNDVNATAMSMDVDQAQQAIEYLKKQIDVTSVAGLQNVFYRLIEKKMEVVMLAQVTDEYLFRTIDPAVTAERKFRPRRLLIGFLGGLAGAVGLTFFVLLWAPRDS